MDIQYALEKLLEENRIFVSESDFQFAYAWKIKELYPNVTIRLEYIPWKFDLSMHIDIVVFCDGKMIPIELKYKTKLTVLSVNGEDLRLKSHSAQDCGRYDFLYDIQRMENIKTSDYLVEKAYAIMLTNDSGYWNKSKMTGTSTPTIDDEFRIHEDVILTGIRSWKEHASTGTMKNREKPINLKNTYSINWNSYQPTKGCLFKYTIVSI